MNMYVYMYMYMYMYMYNKFCPATCTVLQMPTEGRSRSPYTKYTQLYVPGKYMYMTCTVVYERSNLSRVSDPCNDLIMSVRCTGGPWGLQKERVQYIYM